MPRLFFMSFLLVVVSGCSFFGRFYLVNTSDSAIRVTGLPVEGDSIALRYHILDFVTYDAGDGEPYFRDTLIEGVKVLIADVDPNEEVVIGGVVNRFQDSSYLAFRTLVIAGASGTEKVFSSRASIYDSCTKVDGSHWKSKLIYTGK